MSAVAARPTSPLYEEGVRFWQDVVEESRQYVDGINLAATEEGISSDNHVQLTTRSGIYLRKAGFPTTEVKADLSFFAWGPVIQCTISGARDTDHRYLTREFEMPIALDLDGKTVAIFDEGRSFCPHDVACYLTQIFRRCFPSVRLPE